METDPGDRGPHGRGAEEDADGTTELLQQEIEALRAVRASRPILLTSQLAGDDLIERYVSKHPELQTTAKAIVRRIRDFCTTVYFDPLKKNAKPDPPGLI
jgi:hypothetical protein